jgi:hypothetical protein
LLGVIIIVANGLTDRKVHAAGALIPTEKVSIALPDDGRRD